MRVFNATKILSPISYSMELPLLYQNAQLWLQVLLHYFCLEGFKLVDCDGYIFGLKNFVDTLQVACSGLKMHHTWSLLVSTDEYLSRFQRITQCGR